MTKSILILVALILLSACDSGGGSGDPGKTSGGNAPSTQEAPPTWGELECQIEKTCTDPILNMAYDVLLESLADGFWIPLNEAEEKSMTDDEKYFSCGIKTQEFWKKIFPDASDSDEDFFMSFSFRVLDPKSCQVKNEFRKAILNYFTESEDYKNETESNN